VVLVDTSVWIECFRAKPSLRIDELVEFEDIVTCLPVVQEVLQGFRDERPYHIAREAMYALPIVDSPMDRSVFDEAVSIYRSARRQALTVRSGVDCLIAACAIRHGLTVLHHDRDIDVIASVSPLHSRRV
jgi:predicted nucleic acid-binding protein